MGFSVGLLENIFDGVLEGFNDGLLVGELLGDSDFSCRDGWIVIENDGIFDSTVDGIVDDIEYEGFVDGDLERLLETDGDVVGLLESSTVGNNVGCLKLDGLVVGFLEGSFDGNSVGLSDFDGLIVGMSVGKEVAVGV